jgi:hypothetical protein
MEVSAATMKYRWDKEWWGFYQQIEKPHSHLPGVVRKAWCRPTAVGIGGLGRHQRGGLYAATGQELQVDPNREHGYFRTMEIPL